MNVKESNGEPNEKALKSVQQDVASDKDLRSRNTKQGKVGRLGKDHVVPSEAKGLIRTDCLSFT